MCERVPLTTFRNMSAHRGVTLLLHVMAVSAALGLAAGSKTGRGFRPTSMPSSKRPNVSKRKQQKMEALLLRTLHLQDVWERMSASVPSFKTLTQSAEIAPSPTHGLGLFARGDIDQDMMVSLYPVDALGSTGSCLFTGAENEAIFGDGNKEPSRAYRVEINHRSLVNWADDLWVDANPNLADRPGWLAHRANDAASCTAAPTEEAILDYYAQCAERANVILVPFGDVAPIMCLWTLRPISAGEEIFQIYGHDYWVSRQGGDVPPYTEAVLRAAQGCWKQKAQEVVRKDLPRLMQDEIALLEGIMDG